MPPVPSASNQIVRGVVRRDFPPILRVSATPQTSDPHGFLPWMHRVREESKQLILEWNNATGELQVWYWPVVNGQRVPPSELNALRLTHKFHAPCCLCASLSLDPEHVTEAAIFLITTGRLAGEYAAACSQRRCKYWIFLERLYPRPGLPIRGCLEREPGSSVPLAIEYNADELVPPEPSQGSSSSSSSSNVSTPTAAGRQSAPFTQRRPAKRARTGVRSATNGNIDPFFVPAANPVPPTPSTPPTTPFGLLMWLDSDEGVGLVDEQFRSLFMRCRLCRNITTKAAFRHHKCQIQIIDLTGDSDA
ncbi:hypothetical protein BJ912DRAFT_934495 [Pholiota molesta]|nr:hypothetical protein BJ912DRAFT_934495 [Pholiota molesta]